MALALGLITRDRIGLQPVGYALLSQPQLFPFNFEINAPGISNLLPTHRNFFHPSTIPNPPSNNSNHLVSH